MAKKLTTEEFVKRAVRVHGSKYDYTKVKYRNAHTKIIITCLRHGDFRQEPTNHIHIGQGCPTCGVGGNDNERFWNFVDKNGLVTAGVSGRCWNWRGKLHNSYGRFWTNGKTIRAHRYSFELHNAKIPPGVLVLHQCDNPSCVNPKHLFAGSTTDNMQDMSKKGRCRDQYGEKNNMAKLNQKDVDNIREIYATGEYFQRQIAVMFNVSLTTINQIVNLKRWMH